MCYVPAYADYPQLKYTFFTAAYLKFLTTSTPWPDLFVSITSPVYFQRVKQQLVLADVNIPIEWFHTRFAKCREARMIVVEVLNAVTEVPSKWNGLNDRCCITEVLRANLILVFLYVMYL